jgi:hypothetical protein
MICIFSLAIAAVATAGLLETAAVPVRPRVAVVLAVSALVVAVNPFPL